MEKPRWYDEDIKAESPLDDVICKTCLNREKDRMCGSTKILGHTLAICDVYYNCKPMEILLKGANCPYYINESDVGNTESMLGAIIGDIIGSVYEFNNIKTKDFPLFQKGCFATDDSIMTLAIAKAILESDISNSLDLQRNTIYQMKNIGMNYPNCGYGSRFYNWIFSNDDKPYNSFGNGAAMRVSPVAYVAKSLDECKRMSYDVTCVTHNHPEGIKGAETTAVATWLALNKYDKQYIRDYVNENYYNLDFTLDEIRDTYSFSEACQETVPQAIETFLESDDFEDTLRNAISLGGDSDTLAAIACSISAAYYGVPTEICNEALSFLDDDLNKILFKFRLKYT